MRFKQNCKEHLCCNANLRNWQKGLESYKKKKEHPVTSSHWLQKTNISSCFCKISHFCLPYEVNIHICFTGFHHSSYFLIYFQDGVLDSLRRTKLHFVFCLAPHADAGLCELKVRPPSSPSAAEGLMDVPLIRTQIRGYEVLESTRQHRFGTWDIIGIWDTDFILGNGALLSFDEHVKACHS